MSESAFAQHIVSSIRKELELLKNHNYLQSQAYNEILNLLPKDVSTPNRNIMPSGAFPPQQAMNSPPPSSFAGTMPSPAHSQVSNTSSLPPPPSYNTEPSFGTAEALYDFHGDNPSTDLPIRRGDIIQITEYVNNDWWKGTSNGKTGIFPSNYVKKIETPVNEKRASGHPPPPPPQQQQQRDSYGYSPAPNSYNNNYSAPPPNNYSAPPPPSGQANSYGAPPNNYAPPPIQNQVNSYAPPPVQQVATGSSAPVEEQHESKAASLGKKFAGNVANAATWGFGATIGSDIAHSIF